MSSSPTSRSPAPSLQLFWERANDHRKVGSSTTSKASKNWTWANADHAGRIPRPL
ncbi:hypothetical protein RBSWK_05018 [Rhodopirellula baltica SWK14]|uniref:Uncharacterized protein n=1 Tax=Rhodopirellula baltica SWK14 TaxID=993516 RepID=L7CA19_RHOBT|nr:hypothetical protein RBSWK_05018 [Rhodopirellula baltica SWK14]